MKAIAVCNSDSPVHVVRAPREGKRRIGHGRTVSCERMQFGQGFAVCAVRGASERTLLLEAPPSDRPTLHLQYCGNGAGRFVNAAATAALAPGRAALFSTAQGVAAWEAPSNDPLDMLSIDIAEDRLAQWLPADTVPGKLLHNGLPLAGLAPAMLRRLACTLHGASGDPLRRLRVEAAALEALAASLAMTGQEAASARDGAERDRLYEARALLVSGAGGAVPDVTELARQTGLSPARLKRLWRAEFDESLFRSLLDARMAVAYAALAEGKLAVKEIAWRAGYTRASSFTHAFRARYGKAPSEIMPRR